MVRFSCTVADAQCIQSIGMSVGRHEFPTCGLMSIEFFQTTGYQECSSASAVAEFPYAMTLLMLLICMPLPAGLFEEKRL